MKTQIDYNLVKMKFNYDPQTGVLTRKSTGMEAGYVDKSGSHGQKLYKRTSIRYGVLPYVHRIIWVWMTGEQPETIDHIDGNGLNNKWSNLRSVPFRINGKNQKMHSTNTSGFSGVTQRKENGRWRARIAVDGKMIDLGTYTNKQDAVNARRKAEKEYGYEVAETKRHGNRNERHARNH